MAADRSKLLRRSDYERITNAVHGLYDAGLPWAERVLRATAGALPGLVSTAMNELAAPTAPFRLEAGAALRRDLRGVVVPGMERRRLVAEVIGRDEAYVRAHGMLWEGRVVLDQDVMALSAVANREAHTVLYAPVGGKYQLGFPLWRDGRTLTFVNVLRGDRSFSEREREVARLLREQIARARPRGSPALSRDVASRAALSPRQAEVLRWVAEGKRDSEIAVILGTSVRTVNHHVAAVLKALGVENRASAMVVALERSRGGDGGGRDEDRAADHAGDHGRAAGVTR